MRCNSEGYNGINPAPGGNAKKMSNTREFCRKCINIHFNANAINKPKKNWRRKKGAKQKERDFTLALFVWGYSGTTISLTSVFEFKVTLIPTAIAANPLTPILMQYTGKLFPITPLAGIC